MLYNQLRQIDVKHMGRIIQYVLPLQHFDEQKLFGGHQLILQAKLCEDAPLYTRSWHSTPQPQLEYQRQHALHSQFLRTSVQLCIDGLLPTKQVIESPGPRSAYEKSVESAKLF